MVEWYSARADTTSIYSNEFNDDNWGLLRTKSEIASLNYSISAFKMLTAYKSKSELLLAVVDFSFYIAF
jgi:hypothetical protein